MSLLPYGKTAYRLRPIIDKRHSPKSVDRSSDYHLLVNLPIGRFTFCAMVVTCSASVHRSEHVRARILRASCAWAKRLFCCCFISLLVLFTYVNRAPLWRNGSGNRCPLLHISIICLYLCSVVLC